ncbi:Sel1 repeat-containing protein [Toxoplasma gondii RUB]|uniref:Sel1 repeat-containing protein n=1 Tax=Toxoplasma gondii RUB TaxID=935652 RepID=A0A086MB83_TOXGO|nr:Sel1 repeat-containing protein [Toxoplasma gondii RUB]
MKERYSWRIFAAVSLCLLLLLSPSKPGEALRRRESEKPREDRPREDAGRFSPQEAGEALERLLPTLQAREHEAFLNVTPERMQRLQAAVEMKFGENGKLVDFPKATELLRQLASEGRPDAATAQALYELGDMQVRGYPGVLGRTVRDLNSAVRDFRAAALLGYGPALHALGVAYAVGLGSLEPNEAEATRLHYLASLTDYIPAVLATGFRFLHGDGVVADCEAALRYYKFAAERAVQFLAPSPAEGEVDTSGPPPPLGEGDRLTEQTTAQWRELQTVQTQQKEILQYWEQHAKDGNPMAQYELAKLREQQPAPARHPAGSSPDEEKVEAERLRQVADLYKASAEQGLAPALRDLGLLYLQGQGVERNFQKAVECFKRAADLGDPESQNYLGYLYYFGAAAPSSSSEQSSSEGGIASDSRQMRRDQRSPYTSSSGSPPGRPPEYPADGAFDSAVPSSPESSPTSAEDTFVIPRNETLALHYFTQAALKEYPEALFFLGEIEVQAYTAATTPGGTEGETERRRERASSYGLHKTNAGEQRQDGLNAGRGRRVGHAQDDEARLLKALRLYQRAADGGYILAAWREAQLLEAGKGTARSCEDAALAYKLVAEAGPWVDDVRKGISQYVAGDLEGALLTYAFAAEEGYEVAQANAAFLYSRFRPSWESRPSTAAKSSPKPSSQRRSRDSGGDETDPAGRTKKRWLWSAFGDLWGGEERKEAESKALREVDRKTLEARTKQGLIQNPLQMEELCTDEACERELEGEGFTKAILSDEEDREWGSRRQINREHGGQKQARGGRRTQGGRAGEEEREQKSAFVKSGEERREQRWTGETGDSEGMSEEDAAPPLLPQIYRMWNRAALQGNPAALREVAKIHVNGSSDGVIIASPELSVEVLKISLAHGDVKSLPVLASLYEAGTSLTPPMYGRAIDLLKFYAETEQAQAAAGPQQALRSRVGTPGQGWREALQRRFKRWGLAARIGRLKVKEKIQKRRGEIKQKVPGENAFSRGWWGQKPRN